MVSDIGLLEAADTRREQALTILDRTALLDRWSSIGSVGLVGSVALNVVVKPDIDLAVFVDEFSPRRGFEALLPLVDDPTVQEIAYVDARQQPINRLYWKMVILKDGEPWQIDTWALTRDRANDNEDEVTRATRLQAEAIRQRPRARATILRIKHKADDLGELVHGRWLYEAVVDFGVTSYDEYLRWMDGQDARERSTCIPRTAHDNA